MSLTDPNFETSSIDLGGNDNQPRLTKGDFG